MCRLPFLTIYGFCFCLTEPRDQNKSLHIKEQPGSCYQQILLSLAKLLLEKSVTSFAQTWNIYMLPSFQKKLQLSILETEIWSFKNVLQLELNIFFNES